MRMFWVESGPCVENQDGITIIDSSKRKVASSLLVDIQVLQTLGLVSALWWATPKRAGQTC